MQRIVKLILILAVLAAQTEDALCLRQMATANSPTCFFPRTGEIQHEVSLLVESFNERGYIETLDRFGLNPQEYFSDIRHADNFERYLTITYDEAVECLKRRITPFGGLSIESNARNLVLAALDTIEGFKEARQGHNIKRMKELYRENVIKYGEVVYGRSGGQTAFFGSMGLGGLMAKPRPFFRKTTSPAELIRLAVPELIDLTNPDALDPLEVEKKYWNYPANTKYHTLQALFKIQDPETGENFETAYRTYDIRTMARLYRKFVIGYTAVDTHKYRCGGQRTFFYEKAGMSGAFASSHTYLRGTGRPSEYIRLAIPGLIDDNNPDALKTREVEDDKTNPTAFGLTTSSPWEYRFDKFSFLTHSGIGEGKNQRHLDRLFENLDNAGDYIFCCFWNTPDDPSAWANDALIVDISERGEVLWFGSSIGRRFFPYTMSDGDREKAKEQMRQGREAIDLSTYPSLTHRGICEVDVTGARVIGIYLEPYSGTMTPASYAYAQYEFLALALKYNLPIVFALLTKNSSYDQYLETVLDNALFISTLKRRGLYVKDYKERIRELVVRPFGRKNIQQAPAPTSTPPQPVSAKATPAAKSASAGTSANLVGKRNIPPQLPILTRKDKLTILFVMVSDEEYPQWDPAIHLTAGSLIAALEDRDFLKRFFERLGKEKYLNQEVQYPEFDIKIAFLGQESGNTPAQKGAALKSFLERMKNKPDVVCMSLYSEHIKYIPAIREALDGVSPNTVRIIGGVHASIDWQETLKKTGFHVACFGEGVETVCELMVNIAQTEGALDVSDVTGIAFWNRDGRIKENQLRQYRFRLGEYPYASRALDRFWPNLDGLPQKDAIGILTGMGCPHNCGYCASRQIRRGIFRDRDVESIVDEIIELQSRGFYHFRLLDENFCVSRDRVMYFVKLIRDKKAAGVIRNDLVFDIGARADDLDIELIKELADIGLVFLEIGFESADPAVLARVGKRQDLDNLMKVSHYANKVGVGVNWYIMVGLPGQTWQSVFKTALYLDKVRPRPFGRYATNCDMTTLAAIPYPGTRIRTDGSVRIIDAPYEDFIPSREPEVGLEDGKFVGKHYTETDVMLSDEILEARSILHDFYFLYLHTFEHGDWRHRGQLTPTVRMENGLYSRRALYAIFRRTVRDLIVNAQEDLNYSSRRRALMEMRAIDKEAETRFAEYTKERERDERAILYECTANIGFKNGFHVMKKFSIDNRIKWMKLQAMLWFILNKEFDSVRFEIEDEETGKRYNKILDTISHEQLNRILQGLESRGVRGMDGFEQAGSARIEGYGFRFRFDRAKREITVDAPGLAPSFQAPDFQRVTDSLIRMSA